MVTYIADSGIRRIGVGYSRLLLAKDWHPDFTDMIASVAIYVAASPQSSHVTAIASKDGQDMVVTLDDTNDWWLDVPSVDRWDSRHVDRTTRKVATRILAYLWGTDRT